MFKTTSIFIISFTLIASIFPNFSYADLSEKSNANQEEYITVTPIKQDNNNWLSKMVAGFDNITSYGVSYFFQNGLQSESAYYIDGPSVCLDTTPESDVPNPPLGTNFTVDVDKSGFFGGGLKGKKTLIANGGFQRVRWANVGAGEYKIVLSKENDAVYFSDSTARIYNCN